MNSIIKIFLAAWLGVVLFLAGLFFWQARYGDGSDVHDAAYAQEPGELDMSDCWAETKHPETETAVAFWRLHEGRDRRAYRPRWRGTARDVH